MKHNVAGRKLGRLSKHKEAMIQNMVGSLYRYGRITTTLHKAKEARPLADHLITVARRGDLNARRQVLRVLTEKEVVKKLFDEICKWNINRPSGHSRIMRLGWRKGDSAEMVIFELVDRPADKPKKEAKTKKEGKKEEKEEVVKDQKEAKSVKETKAKGKEVESKE